MIEHDRNAGNRGLRIGMLLGSASVAGGGVVEAAGSLARALCAMPGIDVTLFAPEDDRLRFDFGDATVVTAPVSGPAAFGYAPGLVNAILERDIDVLHVHGLWMYMSIAAQKWARATGRPYLVSPHGMLDEWALRNSRGKKWVARLMFENRHLRDAACIHALCAAEGEAVRRAGFHGSLATVPNGVAAAATDIAPAAWRRSIGADEKVLLFLGRITPKKRVTELVEAFGRTWQPGDAWHLVIVGPAPADYLAEIQGVVDSRVRDRVHLVGPAYGAERASAYASADAFVLPSVSEGLPMAALEAFAHGLPALLTPACNLPEAFVAGAALSIDPFVAGIGGGLRRLFAMSDERRMAMGAHARRYVREGYDWTEIARRMARLYAGLASRPAPAARRSRSLTGRAGLPA